MMELDVQAWVKVAAFVGGGIAMGLGAVGAAIGEGYTAAMANAAVSRNPKLSGDIFKNILRRLFQAGDAYSGFFELGFCGRFSGGINLSLPLLTIGVDPFPQINWHNLPLN